MITLSLIVFFYFSLICLLLFTFIFLFLSPLPVVAYVFHWSFEPLCWNDHCGWWSNIHLLNHLYVVGIYISKNYIKQFWSNCQIVLTFSEDVNACSFTEMTEMVNMVHSHNHFNILSNSKVLNMYNFLNDNDFFHIENQIIF